MKIKILTVLFILLVLTITVVADFGWGKILFDLIEYVPGGDQTGHFFFMGMLAFLGNLTLSGARIRVWGRDLLKGSVWVAVPVTLEEFSQIFLSQRGFSLLDLSADYLGILFFGWLALRVLAWRQQHSSR
jgi:VanZ family protein